MPERANCKAVASSSPADRVVPPAKEDQRGDEVILIVKSSRARRGSRKSDSPAGVRTSSWKREARARTDSSGRSNPFAKRIHDEDARHIVERDLL